MSRVKQRDTAPELALRAELWKRSLRYRLHSDKLPGRPDVVFGRVRVAVFVHGCFWHQHGCRKGRTLPASNRDYWSAKLKRNADRDARNLAEIAGAGWLPVVVWECEQPSLAAEKIATLVRQRRMKVSGFIEELIAMHSGSENDLERGVSFEEIASYIGRPIDEVRSETRSCHDQGLAYADRDANGPGGLAERFRATGLFFDTYGVARKR